MDEQILVAKLAELTGSLEPTSEASAADLRAARLALAYAMMCGQKEATHALAPPGIASELLSHPDLRTELEQIVTEAAREADTRSDEPLEMRVFRRELPVLTSQHPASVPSWAAGLQLDSTLGPFRGFGGRPFWFDLYRIMRQVTVVRLPGTVPLFSLPIRSPLRADTSYPLAPGSVWLAAQLLTVSTLTGSYTGLRIRGGTLRLSAPAVVVVGMIQIPASATVTLTLELDTPAATNGTGFGPGTDAANATAHLPAEATFVFAPNRLADITAADASAVLYGVAVPLRRTTLAPVFEPALNRILVPYETSLASFTVNQRRSKLFMLSGTAQIAGVAWALPVTVTSLAALGPASGAGALVVQTRPGLHATCLGLAGGSMSLNAAFLMIEPGRLVVTALHTQSRRATHTLALWVEGTTPRHSSIDLQYIEPFPLRYFSQQSGVETLLLKGTAVAHLDRPLRADGTRLRIVMPRAVLFLFETATGASAGLIATLSSPELINVATEKPLALALANALLKVTPPRTLTLFGTLNGATPAVVQSGDLHLNFELYFILPTLPDPYAANFDVPVEGGGETVARLDCRVQWKTPDMPALSLAFMPLELNHPAMTALTAALRIDLATATRTDSELRGGATPLLSVVDVEQPDRQKIIQEDTARLAKLRRLFDDAVGGTPEQIFLLDVSTNADLFGVCVGFADRSSEDAGVFPVQVEALDLVTAGNNVRLFTVPQIQWEPVWTIQNPDVGPFSSPLFCVDDGGPTRLGVNTVELVPIAPRPALEQIVTAFNLDEDNLEVGALFTLPFGMQAMARLLLPKDQGRPGAFLNLNQPPFPSSPQPLEGGLQLRILAYSPDSGPGFESPTLPGATIQLRNGRDAFNPALLKSVLDDGLDTIFNGEFAPDPDGKRPRVPVTRIDFSGYGASMFSRWANPRAQIAQTSQVRFDVMVGRTAYEVVQVFSILYPWGVRVVRTITIQRTGGGGVFRRDSGWVAVSDGVFDFPAPKSGFKIVTHPGVVKGVFDVRHIRDTSQIYEREYFVGAEKVNVRLAAVYFDADVSISDIVRGGSNGKVASVNQLGFVQLAPGEGEPLTPTQFADLLADQGPLGGPVDCLINIGQSGQQMRVTRVDVDSTHRVGGQIEFAAAGRGSPVLPRDGQWSMVRKPADASREAQALDRDFGIPLVREGIAGLDDESNANPYLFADPADVLTPNLARDDYGWLWSTGTQRILFARPKIAKGAKAITSDLKPLLADSFALINSAAVFPPALLCLEVPFTNYSLETVGEGGLRLVLPSATFHAVRVAGGSERDLGNSATTRFYVDYTNTLITLSLDSTSAQSWTYEQSGLAIVNESDGARLKTSRGKIFADSNTAPNFTLQSEEFGEALNLVKPIMPLFNSPSLGGLIPPSDGITVQFDATQEPKGPEPKIGIKVDFDIPEDIPLFIGTTLDGGSIEITTDFKTFFSLDAKVPILVAELFTGKVRFKYESEVLKRQLTPGSSIKLPTEALKAGEKEELLLAIGVYAEEEFPISPFFQFNFKVFAGLGFTRTKKPGEKSVGVGVVFEAEGSAQYPAEEAIVEAGFKVEGQGIIEFRSGGNFLVLKGKIAFELTVALILDIEFELAEGTVAEIEL